ncbi:transporter [Streptomyces sparsogenes]|uniref:transporter n=1 Tax=Streptomyces sparsogenes TaxID=67365 RepID=UPI0034097E09
MTTGTISRPGPRATVARPGPRGPLWLAWRRRRAALLAGGVLALALAGYLAHQRTGMAAFIADHHLTGCRLWQDCRGRRVVSDSDRPTALAQAYSHLGTYRTPLLTTGRLMLALPAVIGAFVGAPLVARELESGTATLVWSQSLGRRRWLLATLAVPAAATVAATTLLAALFTWWWWPARALFDGVVWGTAVPFDAAGPAPVALSLLSLLLGTACGLLLRRTLPAMACALALTAGALYGLQWLRPRLLSPLTATANVGTYPQTPADAWRLDSGYLTRSGGRIAETGCDSIADPASRIRCFDRHHLLAQYADYHPLGHFWRLQWIQAGICLAAAAALAAFCLWWIGRRRG